LGILGKDTEVQLGDISVKSTDKDAEGIIIGRYIGTQTKSNDAAKIEGNFSAGKIEVESEKRAIGFYVGESNVKGGESITIAPEITGNITIDEIKATSKSGSAYGFYVNNGVNGLQNVPTISGTITLGNITVESENTSSQGMAIGVAIGEFGGIGDIFELVDDTGTIVLTGDVTAKAKSDYAFGVYGGQIGELDVEGNISAEITDNASNSYYAYGIYTRDNSNGSTINILDNASISAKVETGGATAASIRMDAKTDDDVVNINVTNNWTNDDKAFTLLGVEELNVTGKADLSGTDSLRGRATDTANGVAVTNVSGELTVQDEFFNAGTGTSNVTVTKKLEIIQGTGANDNMFVSAEYLNTLTLKNGNPFDTNTTGHV
jgi:hypothetical protein